MKKAAFIIIAVVLGLLACMGQRTTRRGLKALKESTIPDASLYSPYSDTIVSPDKDHVEVNRYDKPLRSRRETIFVTNSGQTPIKRIAFTISYYDTDGKLMHRASRSQNTNIPAGETRMVGFRSWDVQQSFYYKGSTRTKNDTKATAYDVKIDVDTIYLSSDNPYLL